MSNVRPSLEALETRELLAAQVTASLAQNVLTVEGTPGADHIAFWESQNQISVLGEPINLTGRQVASVASSSVSKIVVNTLGGDDVVQLNQDKYGSQPITQPVVINGGDGNDYLAAGWGPTTINAGGGNDTILAGPGTDTINTGTGNNTIYESTGNATIVNGGGKDTVIPPPSQSPAPSATAPTFNTRNWAPAGIQPADVIQQQAPTCAFLAALQTVAQTDPSFLNSGITYLGWYEYQVRLFRPNADGVTGTWVNQVVYYNGTVTATDCRLPSDGDYWAILYQRAWEQERTFEGKSDVAFPSDAFLALTGRAGGWDWATNLPLFQALVSNPGVKLVVATNTNPSAISPMLIANHAYSVVGIDPFGNVVVRNPWGYDGGAVASGNPNDGLVTLTWAQFSQSMLTIWYD